jgi:hypothetical protein
MPDLPGMPDLPMPDLVRSMSSMGDSLPTTNTGAMGGQRVLPRVKRNAGNRVPFETSVWCRKPRHLFVNVDVFGSVIMYRAARHAAISPAGNGVHALSGTALVGAVPHTEGICECRL